MAQSRKSSGSAFCNKCGFEIGWRTIDGRRTPIGCRCDYGDYGLSQFYRDRAASTTCPTCHEKVFFVRHNGGSVWFDTLGEPWAKHECFAQDKKSSKELDEPKSVILTSIESTDLGQRIAFVSHLSGTWAIYPAPDFWLRIPEPKIGDKLLIDLGSTTLQFEDLSLCKFWGVVAFRCINCNKHYLNNRFHKESCKNRSDPT